MKTKKLIIVTIVSLITVSVAAGWYMYNKGPRNIKNREGIAVDAGDLYSAFTNDGAAAQKMYADKIVEVAGTVARVEENQQKQQVVFLQTKEEGAYINSTLEEKSVFKEGDQVIIKGICSGIGQGDEDLGLKADVYLIRSYLIKK